MTQEGLLALLAELFPVADDTFQIELGNAPAVCVMPVGRRKGADSLHLTLSLVTWDYHEETGAKSIREIKEQQLVLGPVSLLDSGERLTAFLRGYRAALQALLDAEFDAQKLWLDDLWHPEVLKLVRAQTADDFRQALLAPSRLGRHLPKAAANAPAADTSEAPASGINS